MTKSDILERIMVQKDAQSKAVELTNKILALQNVSADATAIGNVLATINATIFDTMTTLALILCELMPEKAPEPKKGEHSDLCTEINKSCLCNTCANDRCDDCEACCVKKHGMGSCVIHECSDYVKEDQ